MTDPYNWNFPQRADTMYMSTIGTSLLIKKTHQICQILVRELKDNQVLD